MPQIDGIGRQNGPGGCLASMKKKKMKLGLEKETLRALATNHLEEAVGGLSGNHCSIGLTGCGGCGTQRPSLTFSNCGACATDICTFE